MTTTEVIRSELLRIEREEGIKKTASKAIINLHLANHSVENITKWLKYPKEFVETVLEKYQLKESIKSMLQKGNSIDAIKNTLEVTDDLIQEAIEEKEY